MTSLLGLMKHKHAVIPKGNLEIESPTTNIWPDEGLLIQGVSPLPNPALNPTANLLFQL